MFPHAAPGTADSPALPADPELESFRRWETSFILLNVSVLSALFLLHVAFLPQMGPPSFTLVLCLAALFALQMIALAWVRNSRAVPAPGRVQAYAWGSIMVSLATAYVVAVKGEGDDHHYAVLMLPAVVSAAFRFSLRGTLGVAVLAGVLSLLDVMMYYRANPPLKISELFEASTVSMVFFVVATVVWLLSSYLRRDQLRLRRSLEELGRARDRLVAEEKLAAVGRLSSAIAHEIRNPVAMISSSLATAGRGTLDEGQRAQMYDIAAQEAERLERLTGDFLSYARPAAPERRATQLASALGYVAELARARALEARVDLVVDCPDSLEARADSGQLHRALLNLVGNALAASPAGGRVTIGARPADGGAAIWVENGGEAIPAGAAAHIFEPFFTTRPSGTGLGLPISRNIARAHGGDLVLARNEAGRVRFEIFLPQAAVAAPVEG